MSYATDAMRSYSARRGNPGPLDAAYHYELTLLHEILERLEIILQDEGVDGVLARRIIRCLLYGSPSPAAAEQRMRHEEEIRKLLTGLPHKPFAP